MTTVESLPADQYETVARWLSSPTINRWLSGDWRDKETTSTVIGIAVRNRKNRFYLVKHEGQPCGLVALSDLELVDKTGMVWYLMGDEQLRGKGIIGDAVRQLLRIAFSEIGLRSVYAWAIEGNAASLRLLEKAGFRTAGRIRRSATLAGVQCDRLYFDIIPDEVR